MVASVSPIAAVPGRRTQEERTASTRGRLLDATISTLDELGYTGTTTTEIARRAGVSRGAQLHHFPTKQELVVSALEHLFERRRTEFVAAFAAQRSDGHPLEAAIDLLWTTCSGTTFNAFLELLVAARTDVELHARLAPLTRHFRDETQRTFLELFGDRLERGPLFDIAPQFAFALLDGLALNRITDPDGDDTGHAIDALKALARLVMQEVPQ